MGRVQGVSMILVSAMSVLVAAGGVEATYSPTWTSTCNSDCCNPCRAPVECASEDECPSVTYEYYFTIDLSEERVYVRLGKAPNPPAIVACPVGSYGVRQLTVAVGCRVGEDFCEDGSHFHAAPPGDGSFTRDATGNEVPSSGGSSPDQQELLFDSYWAAHNAEGHDAFFSLSFAGFYHDGCGNCPGSGANGGLQIPDPL